MRATSLRGPGRYVVISVMGPHAGEPEGAIFSRKMKEIADAGKSFWFIHSVFAKPDQVQKICEEAAKEGRRVFCLFIRASSKHAARNTKPGRRAEEFSADRIHWKKISREINAISATTSGYALVFDKLKPLNKEQKLDLWKYSQRGRPGKALVFKLGGSTVCCDAKPSEDDPRRMRSNMREVVAIGRLASPYGVWVRQARKRNSLSSGA